MIPPYRGLCAARGAGAGPPKAGGGGGRRGVPGGGRRSHAARPAAPGAPCRCGRASREARRGARHPPKGPKGGPEGRRAGRPGGGGGRAVDASLSCRVSRALQIVAGRAIVWGRAACQGEGGGEDRARGGGARLAPDCTLDRERGCLLPPFCAQSLDQGARRHPACPGLPHEHEAGFQGEPPKNGLPRCCCPPPPPPSRTDWTRLVPHPVLTGHVSSLLPAALPRAPLQPPAWCPSTLQPSCSDKSRNKPAGL